ncbi:PA14 domain-containing protein [Spirosoma pollinicola]|uniref:Glycoside hydrolase n=1 Tax=Spirosoma pollinicola TaxID=2057025 RepID=A0A2K8YV15_9BACT|nr:PA14 domain-containing protein [Spirosoma pollinicola]AUD01461.1 glycoside hydrolase [Spirosoma pollinicola]
MSILFIWKHGRAGRLFLVCNTLMLFLCSSWQFVTAQTTYYVANSGNDANNGRSEGSPFQTLAKINSLSLQAGDVVLFRRGDTFRGNLQIRQSGASGRPIIIDAFGSGNKPILAGSVQVSNWNNIGNNVWEAACPSCGSRVTGVYRNASTLPLGRYPNLSDSNKGYLTIQSHGGKTSLTSQQALSQNWTGGEAVVRPTQWILDRAAITQQNGNTLTLSNNSSYDLADGWGYFIQNHPATLDQVGEWYYNPSTKTIRLFDNQNNPNNQTITATNSDGISLNNSSYITVHNIKITETLGTGVSVNGGSNITLSGDDITNSGEDAVAIIGSNNTILAENNLIEDANSSGFYIGPYQNFTFRGNTLRRIGILPGRGKSGDGTYSAVQSLCTGNTLIENNLVDNVGYNGISVVTSATVRYNQVSNFCLTKSDGGGIYTWNGSRANVGDLHIISNIVFSGIGAPEGTRGGAYSGANGIFLDDCSQNVEVANNTSFGSKGMGIFLRGVSSISVKGNTTFNNSEEQIKLAYNGACAVRNNDVQNNIFFSRLPNQVVASYESNANDLTNYGQFNYNYYVRPFDDLFKIRAVYNPGSGITGADYTLTGWQALYGKDANSSNSPITYKSQVVSQTGASLLSNSFGSNTEGWSVWSPNGNGRTDWDNTNKLDGGSLRISFTNSQANSYLLATVPIGAVTKGKSYQLLFDGIASGANKRIDAFPRQLSGNYSDLSARSTLLLGTTRQQYEAVFTATADEANAILVFQVTGDGQTAWVDNIRLKEATLSTLNPDDYIKLVYNATGQNATTSLNGNYRDAKNTLYSNQITLPAYSSAVLMKETTTTPPPPVTLRDPENPANTVSGLNYQYYEGSWTSMPDFNGLTPGKTGTVATTDITVRNRTENYGLRFKGYINAPTDGTYTFYTSSDDGSKLLIGTTEVVNNDGVHGTIEKSGTIGLKAGKHAITILFFQGDGGQEMTTSYSGPGVNKQTIPASAYFRVSAPVTTGNGSGLLGEYFNNINLSTPIVSSRTDATVNFDWGNNSPIPGTVGTDNFSVRWTGQVEAPVTGNYTFSTISDDGVRLWVNGNQVINNWTTHAPATDNSNSIALTAGQRYTIKMEYFESSLGAVAKLMWAYPGQPQQAIPQGFLYPASPTTPTAGTSTYLSDLNWTSATNGYGPVEKDRSNGEINGGDGRAIILNGVTYPKGLGVHAPSQITYALNGQYTHFITDMGMDDEIATAGCGTVTFEVYLDNVLAYSSGVMNPTTATKSIDLNITGKQTLKLVVTNGGDNTNCDHADWAGARVTTSSGGRLADQPAIEFTPELALHVYPIPAHNEISIRYIAETAGEVSLQLVTTGALPVIQSLHQVIAGENLLRLPVAELSRGFYILNMVQGTQRFTRKVILSE